MSLNVRQATCVHRSETCCQTLKHFDNVIAKTNTITTKTKQTNKQTKQIFICRTLCFNIKLDTSSTMVCTNTVKHDNIVKNLEAPRSYKDDIHLYIGIQGRIQDFKLGGRT